MPMTEFLKYTRQNTDESIVTSLIQVMDGYRMKHYECINLASS